MSNSTAYLERHFAISPNTNQGMTGLNKLSTEEMKNCLQGCATRLLQHYIEVLGNDLVKLIEQGIESDASATGEINQLTWSKPLLIHLDSLVKEISNSLGRS